MAEQIEKNKDGNNHGMINKMNLHLINKTDVHNLKESPELPKINGIIAQITPEGKYRITDEETGLNLPFVLQGKQEAEKMQSFLAKARVIQNTCFETKKLLDSCQIYQKADFLNRDYIDLYVDNNPYIVGLDKQIASSEDMESIVRGKNNNHSMKDGISPFTGAIVSFLNKTHKFKG